MTEKEKILAKQLSQVSQIAQQVQEELMRVKKDLDEMSKIREELEYLKSIARSPASELENIGKFLFVEQLFLTISLCIYSYFSCN